MEEEGVRFMREKWRRVLAGLKIILKYEKINTKTSKILLCEVMRKTLLQLAEL